MRGIIGITPGLTYRVLQCCSWERTPVSIIVQSGKALTKVFGRSRFCAKIEEVDLAALCACPEKAIPVIQELCERLGIDFLIPSCMSTTLLLATIKDRLRGIEVYPCSDPVLIRQLSNKLEFAKILDNLALPQPKYWDISSAAEIEGATWTYPIVMKPLCLDDSVGVKVCSDQTRALAHFEALRAMGETLVLVQEFIPGHDLDITVLAKDGELAAWSIFKHVPHKKGGKILRFMPHPGYLDVARQFAKALHYTGIFHIDGRLSSVDGSVKLIECNPRMFGSVHSTVYAGLNFIAAGGDMVQKANPIPVEPLQNRYEDLNSPRACLSLLRNREDKGVIFTKATRNAWLSLINDPFLSFGWWRRRKDLSNTPQPQPLE